MTTSTRFDLCGRRLSVALAIFTVLAGGCAADEASFDDGDDASHEPVTLPVYIGAPSPPVGVVAVTMGDGYACSGVMISFNAVLTAAHCLRSSGVGSGQPRDVQAGVVFAKADGRLVCLTDSSPVRTDGPRNPRCASTATYRASVHPNFTSLDADDDLAVLTFGGTFLNVSASELAYIDVGRPSTDRLEFHGYGLQEPSGATGGSARSASEVPSGINAQSITIAGRTTRPCAGDSGGPLTELFARTAPHLLVVGLQSWTQGQFTTCPADGAQAHFTRVGPKLPFIEEAIGTTCERFSVPYGTGTRVAARCFRLTATIPGRQR